MKKGDGFTLIELLVVIGIIGILSSIVFVSLARTRYKARDTRRRSEISQIGRFFAATNCFLPDSGPGDYDLADLFNEIKNKYPQQASFLKLPVDPKTGNTSKTNYRYKVETSDRCIIYTNLENENEKITLTNITTPSLGVGSGVLRSDEPGVNGTNIYFQYSK